MRYVIKDGLNGTGFLNSAIKKLFLSGRKIIIKNIIYITSVILFPILIGVISGRGDLFSISSLSVLFISLADPGGVYRIRLMTIMSGTILLLLAYILATVTANSIIATLCVILLFTFGAGMISVFGSRGVRLGSISIICIIIFASKFPQSPDVMMNCIIILTGGLWVGGLKLPGLVFHPHQHAFESVADFYEILNKQFVYYIKNGYTSGADASENDIPGKFTGIQRVRNIAYLNIRDLKTNYNSEIRKMHLLLQKGDLLFAKQVFIMESINSDYFEKYPPELKDSIEMIINFTHVILEKFSASIRSNKVIVQKSEIENAISEIRRTILSIEKKTAGNENMIYPHNEILTLQNLEQYLIHIKDAVNILEAQVPETQLIRNRTFRPVNGIKERLKQLTCHLTADSRIFRHSLRIAAVLAAATAIEIYFKIPYGYWIPVTIAIILKPDYHATRQRTLERIGGTFAGSIIAVLAVYQIQNLYVHLSVIIILILFAFANRAHNYGLYTFFWTPAIILLIDFNNPGTWYTAIERLSNSFAGGIIAYCAIYFFIPQWEEELLPEQIEKVIASHRRYGESVLGLYAGHRDASDDIKQTGLQARRDLNSAAAALVRMSKEPESKRKNFKQFYNLVVFNLRLGNILTALLSDHPQLTSEDEMPGMEYLSHQYNEVFQKLENTLRNGRVPEIENVYSKMMIADKIQELIVSNINPDNRHINSSYNNFLNLYLPFSVRLQYLYRDTGGLYNTPDGVHVI